MASSRIVVVDCETTGFGKGGRVIEVAAITVDLQSWRRVDEYATLVNAERDLGHVSIHGITPTMLEAAPTFAEVAGALARRLHGSVLVAHNINFDARMLSQEFGRLGVDVDFGSGLCTLRASHEKLELACRRYGISIENPHLALADARATVDLAANVFEPSDFETAQEVRFGELPHVASARTLSREGSGATMSEIERIVSLARYPYSDDALLQYENLLDRVLDDHYIDEDEHAAMAECAESLGITAHQREDVHRAYLKSIIAAAERDGIVTDAEDQIIRQVSEALEITDVEFPEITKIPLGGRLDEGTRICFTGEAVLGSVVIERQRLQEVAAHAGMQPVNGVTKKACDLLVAADSSSQSGKARKARQYGIPVMSVDEFLKQLNVDPSSLG